MSTNLPQQFGKYVLLRKIAMGGMAEIFRAKATGAEGFEKDIVIKRILPHFTEDESFVKMFIDEASIAAKLQHANIVQIFDFDTHDGRYYIAMEYVEGKDLKNVMADGVKAGTPLSHSQCVWVVAELAKGLHYAHTKTYKGKPLNIVHRDISPHNAMISFNGEVKLMDFGIAKAASRSTKTMAGTVKGKCAYMSPEQARGKPLDGRSDLFALGVVLWEMLTHKRLFLGDSDFETLTKVLKEAAPAPSSLNPAVPKALDVIVLKALEKDRDKRYKDVQEFNRELTRWFYQNVNDMDEIAIPPFMQKLFKGDMEQLETMQAAERTIALAPMDAPEPVSNADRTLAMPMGDVDVQAAKTLMDDSNITEADVRQALAKARAAAQANPDAATQAIPQFMGPGSSPSQPAMGLHNTGTMPQHGGPMTGTFAQAPPRSNKGLTIALIAILLAVVGGVAWMVLGQNNTRQNGNGGQAPGLVAAPTNEGRSILILDVKPVNAKVTADGVVVDGRVEKLKKGQEVTFVVSAPGFKELSKTVTVDGPRKTVDLTLTKIAVEVAVMIKPTPADAIVVVNGKVLGSGAHQIRHKDGEEVTVEIRPKNGGASTTQKIVISEATPVVELSLPVASVVAGELTLSGAPAGTAFKASKGSVEARGDDFVLVGVSVGDSVKIEASRSGYARWSMDVAIKDAAGSMTVKMTKKEVDTGPGSLFINAKPWAKVTVDGKSKGTTPVSIKTIASGRHKVVLTKGGQSKSLSVTVKPGKKRTVVHDFTK